MKFKRFLNFEWDAIAGIIAAVIALILHLLHIVDEHVILPIVLALIALLLINFMRHTRNNEITAEQVNHALQAICNIQSDLKAPDVVLIGPRHLRSANEHFIRQMSGDTLWYNLCMSMYQPQPLFDVLLRPAVENPLVKSIQFVLDESQRELWVQEIQPKISTCHGSEKVREPRWRNLSRTVSFILADNQANGDTEALLSFWGEPFMAQTTDHDVPRFIFHVQKNSELLPHLVELERNATRKP